MFTALIPVKGFRSAKQRLSTLLKPDERYELAVSMFLDALALMSQVLTVNDIAVVTVDPVAQRLARRHGARVLEELVPTELNAALNRSAATLAREGVSHLFVLPTDTVLAMPSQLTQFTTAHLSHEVGLTVAAASFDFGTNGLLVTPPDAIPFCFGRLSSIRHYQVARTRGYKASICWVPSLDRDIDRPADLKALCRELQVRQYYKELRTNKSIQQILSARSTASIF